MVFRDNLTKRKKPRVIHTNRDQTTCIHRGCVYRRNVRKRTRQFCWRNAGAKGVRRRMESGNEQGVQAGLTTGAPERLWCACTSHGAGLARQKGLKGPDFDVLLDGFRSKCTRGPSQTSHRARERERKSRPRSYLASLSFVFRCAFDPADIFLYRLVRYSILGFFLSHADA